jgi:hypothetical protein
MVLISIKTVASFKLATETQGGKIMVYLLKSASFNSNKVYYKIGFANNITNRLKNGYITDNPSVQLVESIMTYKKTKHSLEKELHNELKNKGYKFHIGLFNIKTEWFEVDINDNISLKNFKSCKNRKVIQYDL